MKGVLGLVLLFLFGFPLSWGLLLFLKTFFLGFNWQFLGKWFLGILLLAEIRFIFVVELPLLSYVMSASCPLASSSTWMRVIKVFKDISFCLSCKFFWNYLQDCGRLSSINYASYHQIIFNLEISNTLIWFLLCMLYVLNLIKIVVANTIIMEIIQRETE